MKLDFVFVCHGGELEIKAALLAASIRTFCPPEAAIHVITPVPEERYGPLRPAVRRFLEDLGAEFYRIKNPIADDYKIGNKLNAFKISPRGERIVFLHSDLMFVQPFEGYEPFFEQQFAAKQADWQTFDRLFGRRFDWANVYDLFGLPFPQMAWPAHLNGVWGPPYFNAGFLAVDPAIDFSTHWIDTCQKIKDYEPVGRKFPWLDQIGLPVTLLRRGFSYQCLSERFNHPLHLKKIEDSDPLAVHYHRPEFIRQNPSIWRVARGLIEAYDMAPLLEIEADWALLLQDLPPAAIKREAGGRRRAEPRVFFVTGIPGSGARLVADHLNALPGLVVLDEPLELWGRGGPTALEPLIGQWRRRITTGEPIRQAVRPLRDRAGHVVLSQGVLRGREAAKEGFVLGVKSSLALLPWLKELRRAHPRALIINVIRHPAPTIAAWIHRHPHLREVWLRGALPYGLEAPHVDEETKNRLLQIDLLKDLSLRRAGFWSHLASQNLPGDPFYLRLRYEDLIKDQSGGWPEILTLLLGEACPQIKASAEPWPALPQDPLSRWQAGCINQICVDAMDRLGYELAGVD